MAVNRYTTDYLVDSIKRRGFIPSSSSTYTAEDILALANEELQEYVMNTVLECHEEYLVATYDVAVESGVANYDLPSRAVGGLLRTVEMSVNGSFEPLTRIEPGREQDYPVNGSPAGYVVEANHLVLVPTPTSASDTLRMKYFARPNYLVTPEQVGVITNITAATNIVTVSSAPEEFVSGIHYDFVRGIPHFDCVAVDLVGTVSGTNITFSEGLPDGLAIGDHVCLAGESDIPQIPVNLHPLLAQRTAGKILEGLGDSKSQAAYREAEAMRTRAMNLMKPRVQSGSRFVINRNGPGWGSRNWGR